jgi:hypothetical protein
LKHAKAASKVNPAATPKPMLHHASRMRADSYSSNPGAPGAGPGSPENRVNANHANATAANTNKALNAHHQAVRTHDDTPAAPSA